MHFDILVKEYFLYVNLISYAKCLDLLNENFFPRHPVYLHRENIYIFLLLFFLKVSIGSIIYEMSF